MEPDQYSHSSIRNLYLDTPDFRLICRSLEKPVYKEKLRVRSYGRAGAIPLWMVRALSGQGVFQTSFSKYGTAYRDLLAAGKGGVKYA